MQTVWDNASPSSVWGTGLGEASGDKRKRGGWVPAYSITIHHRSTALEIRLGANRVAHRTDGDGNDKCEWPWRGRWKEGFEGSKRAKGSQSRRHFTSAFFTLLSSASFPLIVRSEERRV